MATAFGLAITAAAILQEPEREPALAMRAPLSAAGFERSIGEPEPDTTVSV